MTDDDPPPTLNLSSLTPSEHKAPRPARLVFNGAELFVDQRPLTITLPSGKQKLLRIDSVVVSAIHRWESGERVAVEDAEKGGRRW